MGTLTTRRLNAHCLVCKKLIYRRPVVLIQNKGKAFCGSACFGVWCRREHSCSVCGKAILAGLHKKTCSRICANKHRSGIVYGRGRPMDKTLSQRSIKLHLFELRGPKCERCGYSTQNILELHHRDRNRTNNVSENLEILCPNCHAQEHHSKSVHTEESDSGLFQRT